MPATDPASWPKLNDLMAGIAPAKFHRLWQQSFEQAITAAATRGRFRKIEAALAALSDGTWATLRQSVLGQIDLRDPHRGWPQALDRLHEVHAYQHLLGRGCTDIAFVPATATTKTPDLRASLDDELILCEVKVIKIPSSNALSPTFFRKLATRLDKATAQLRAVPQSGSAHLLVYIVFVFAEIPPDHIDSQTAQARDFAETMLPRDVEIVFHVS
jgi:hypothetical protein